MVAINLLPTTHITALLVEDILASYPLNPRRAGRIRDLAIRRFSGKPDLEEIYLFIDSLVEGGVKPEDFFASLENPDRIPSARPGPLTILVERERGETLTYGQIASAVRELAGPEYAATLETVLDRARISRDAPSPATLAEVKRNIETIRDRLIRIRERIKRCGILVPGRPVDRVSFKGPELFMLRGNYISMVTDRTAMRIFEAHRLGLSQTGAAGFAGVARDTVKRWWDRAGLAPNRNEHNALSGDRAEAIVKGHDEHRGNASAAAKGFGVATSTVIRYWKAAGLRPRGRPPALSKGKLERILEAHARFGGNATLAASALKISASTVRKYWKRNGLAPRRPGRPKG
jgi:DNA invertase Pin-like site-specific DNA recombinase